MSIYNCNGTVITSIYDYAGQYINSGYDVDGNVMFQACDYDTYTISTLYTINVTNCQSIAIDNDVLFQLIARGSSIHDKVCLFNFADGSDIIRDMAIESDHGNSASFSPTYYDANDEFPLIYVTADTNPAKIYVDRVTRNSATLIKTLAFPMSAGYLGSGAYDWNRNLCYLVSYKLNKYLSDEGGTNKVVVSKWDLTTLTDNGNGTYTPSFISQYVRDFIYCMQGITYHDGLIWIASGYTNTEQYIYAIDPADGALRHTIHLDDSIEIEGLQFVFDSDLHTYYLVVGQQDGLYKKITFATA